LPTNAPPSSKHFSPPAAERGDKQAEMTGCAHVGAILWIYFVSKRALSLTAVGLPT
jgi:hypothetical protein